MGISSHMKSELSPAYLSGSGLQSQQLLSSRLSQGPCAPVQPSLPAGGQQPLQGLNDAACRGQRVCAVLRLDIRCR